MPDRSAFVYLVHGTWAHLFRNRWSEEGSPFRVALAAAFHRHGLSCEIQEFSWSGANSVEARYEASHDLAQLLRAKLPSPIVPRVLIAHSHGGHVALRALAILRETGQPCDDVLVITLATPFLRVRYNVLHYFHETSRRLIWFVSFALTFEVLSFDLMISGIRGWILWMVGSVVGPFASMLLLWALQSVLIGSRYFSIEERIRFLDIANWTPIANIRLLALRGPNDEAALAVAAAAAGERLARLAAGLEGRPIEFFSRKLNAGKLEVVGALMFSMLWAASYFDVGLLPSSLHRACRVVWVALFSGALLLILLDWAIVFCSRLCRAFFGREFLRADDNFEVSADSAPDSGEYITIRTLEPSDTTFQMALRHSIYEHPDVANEIAKWLRLRVSEL